MISRGGKTVYWGELECEGRYANNTPCTEKARYSIPNGSLRCGTHSGKNQAEKRQRRTLVKNPNLQQNKDAAASRVSQAADHAAQGRVHAAEHDQRPLVYDVIATPFNMRKEWSFQPTMGYAPIFPNHRHGHGFNYGFGDYSHLSPMKLGPVMHGQKGIGAATCVENYYQFNKVYSNEVLEDTPCTCLAAARWEHLKPGPAFYTARENGYRDPKPHRRKSFVAEADDDDDEGVVLKNSRKRPRANASPKPLFSVHIDAAGVERHFTYVESRYFYCHQMEELVLRGGAENSNTFRRLIKFRDNGYRIQLVGYDAYTPDATDKDTLYRHYCDPARPFGHELVLLTLLVSQNSTDWNAQGLDLPWNRYYAEHREVYE